MLWSTQFDCMNTVNKNKRMSFEEIESGWKLFIHYQSRTVSENSIQESY